MLEWTGVIMDIAGDTLALASCPTCSALVPNWPDAKLNHERWHEQDDGGDGA